MDLVSKIIKKEGSIENQKTDSSAVLVSVFFIGWKITGSTSISINSSYKVPSKVGTKQVKTGTLKTHTVYKTKK